MHFLTILWQAETSRTNINSALVFIVPIVVGFGVWYLQWRINNKNVNRIEAARVAAVAKAEDEREKRHTLANEHTKVLLRLDLLEKSQSADNLSFTLLKQDMMPVSEFMKRKAIEALEHPSDEFETPDALLNQLKPVGASMPPELLPWLQERIDTDSPHVGKMEKLYAKALPIFTEMAILEAEELAKNPDKVVTALQLVTSSLQSPATKAEAEGSPVSQPGGYTTAGEQLEQKTDDIDDTKS